MITKIFGPPGTGKTTYLLDMLEQVLVSGVSPERVAFLTFTVAARKEATERVMKRFGFEIKRLPYFRTLHSIAFHQLGIGRHSMFARDSLAEFARLTSLDFTLGSHDVDTDDFDVTISEKLGDRMMTFDHLRRHYCMSLDAALAESRMDVDVYTARYFTDAYARFKRDEGLYDFTDLLGNVKGPLDVDVVFIDEAQDLSILQWAAVDVLTATTQHVVMAGDDDQAIFTWAGAHPFEFITRKADEVTVLAQSHRVPRRVHAVAGGIADGISFRKSKMWLPREEEGALELLTDIDGWTPEAGGKTFVLYRNHYLAARAEVHLRERGYAYARHDRTVVRGFQWAKAIVAYERLRKARGDGTKEDKELVARAVMPGTPLNFDAPWFDALDRIDPADVQYLRGVLARHGNAGLLGEPPIELMTIHASKGREADHVVMFTEMSRRSMDGFYEDGDDELRVYYVGVTRTKNSLTLIGTENPIFHQHLTMHSTDIPTS